VIQAYADGSLVYDSRLDEYRLLALSYTAGVNLSGTATLQLPPNHPAARSFVAYKTVVTIYRDGSSSSVVERSRRRRINTSA